MRNNGSNEMDKMTYLLTYWRESLVDAQKQLDNEPFTACRDVLRQRIANYRKWIEQGESA